LIQKRRIKIFVMSEDVQKTTEGADANLKVNSNVFSSLQ